MEWCDKSLPRFQAKHVCRIDCIENLTANNACHKKDEKGGLLEQNASLKLNQLHFEPGYKRLEKGTFNLPRILAQNGRIDRLELSLLLEGVVPKKVKKRYIFER